MSGAPKLATIDVREVAEDILGLIIRRPRDLASWPK
jgi:hypothetical protein